MAPVAQLPSDGYAVVFHGASGPDVLALWSVTTPSAAITIARAGDVLDAYGASRGPVAAGGTIMIGPDVTYVVMSASP